MLRPVAVNAFKLAVLIACMCLSEIFGAFFDWSRDSAIDESVFLVDILWRALLPWPLLPEPNFQRLRQLADQQRMPPRDPAVDWAGWPSLKGFIEQHLRGDMIVDQAEFVL